MRTARALLSKCNLYDIVTRLPRNGVGYKLRRKTWPENSYWKLTQVKISVKQSVEGMNHGKAWGHFTWLGDEKNEEPTRVRGAHKKVWQTADSTDTTGWKPLPPRQTPPAVASPDTV